MKTQPRYPTTAPVLMLAILLVLSNAAQFGVSVVCFGSDGLHTDVESASCGCCSTPAPPSGQTNPKPAPAIPSCSDCIDVSMEVTSVESRAPLHSEPQINTERHIAATSNADGCGTSHWFAGSRTDLHRHSPSLLSTVVLLT